MLEEEVSVVGHVSIVHELVEHHEISGDHRGKQREIDHQQHVAVAPDRGNVIAWNCSEHGVNGVEQDQGADQ